MRARSASSSPGSRCSPAIVCGLKRGSACNRAPFSTNRSPFRSWPSSTGRTSRSCVPRMNPFLQLLEDWSTHQDYFWFLAALAWSGVFGAEFRRKEHAGGAAAEGWLMALALSQIAGALLELVLLAQDIMKPYARLDAAMGVAQACGTAALAWGATSGVRR